MSAPDGVADRSRTRQRSVPLSLGHRRAVLVVGDLLVVAVLTVVALRLGAARSGWLWSVGFLASQVGWFVLFGAMWVVLAWANGLYDLRRAPDRWASAVLSIKVSVQIAVLWAVAYFFPPPWTLVRHVVVFFAAGAAVVMPLWRQVYAAVFSRAAFQRRLLIVGAGLAGRTLLDAVMSDTAHGIEVLGFVDDDPELAGTTVDGVPLVADRTDLAEAAERLNATDLALAIIYDVHGEMIAALMEARERGVVVAPMPVMYEELTGRVPVEHVGDHWAVALPLDPPEARGLYPLVKRLVDLLAAVLGALVLAISVPIVWPLVKLSSPGPVFLRQKRVGRYGQPFSLYKYRTMIEDAEPDGPVWASPDDPRVTSIGRILRVTRLDELPQFVNIFRGEMSVVGPRPERPAFVEELAKQIPFYRARHAVRPGLTGWATVHEGYASSTADALVKLQRDLYYIKHQSVFLDVYILLRTVAAVLRMAGR